MARIGVIPDSFDDLRNPDFTTCLLIESFLCKGHEVAVTTIDHLFLHNNRAFARWKPGPLGDGEFSESPLSDCDLVLMRKDPPFDEAYINALFILDYAGTLVLNDPRAIRQASEKIFPLQWPDLAPETYVTRDPKFILELWRREKRDWILKPAGSFDSNGVKKLARGDADAEEKILELTGHRKKFVIVQEFLPRVAEGEKRVLLLDGKPCVWFRRKPKPGGFLVATQHGGISEPCDLDVRDLNIIEKIAPFFTMKTGLPFAGLDMIDGRLTEVNLTSPSGVIAANRFSGRRHQDDFTAFFLSKITSGRKIINI